MAISVPLVLILLDVYPLNRFKAKEKPLLLILEKLPFFVLSLISGMITLWAQGTGMAIKSFHEFSAGERFLNAIRALIFYLEQTLWPSRLAPFYPFPKNLTVTSGSVVGSALLIFAITFFCIWMWGKRQKFWLTAWLYYLITIFPVIGILQVGLQGAADRYTYLPTLSVYFLFGVGILWVMEKNSNKLLKNPLKAGSLICSLAVITCLSFLTVQQIRIWQNGESFWKYIITIYPNQISFLHFGLGDFYREKGLLEKAETEFKTALVINPEDVQADYNLGLVYYEKREFEKAEGKFKRTLMIHPENFQAHYRLGLIYGKSGQLEKAELAFKNALNIDSKHVPSHNNLGLIYAQRGQLKNAERELKYILRIKPEYLQAYNNLGLVYQEMGMPKKAIESFKTGLKFDPSFVEVYNNLGLTYFKAGQLEDAENAYKKALEIDAGFEAAHFNLAQLYRATGR